MNRNAANALLKILEEPPRRALLLLVSHSPGRLLPTIRSRCRRFPLAPLPLPLVAELLRRYRGGIAEEEAAALAGLSGGSIGRALELAEVGGLDLYRALLDLLARAPRLDAATLHGFADSLLGAEAEDAYRAFEELLSQLLARIAAAAAGRQGAVPSVAGEGRAIARLAGAGDAAGWAELRAEAAAAFERTRDLNLDRKQTILAALFAIADRAR